MTVIHECITPYRALMSWCMFNCTSILFSPPLPSSQIVSFSHLSRCVRPKFWYSMAHNPKDCCAPWRVLELNIVQPTKSWCMQQRILMRESWPGIVCIKHFLNINFSPGGRLDNTELQSYFNGYKAREHYISPEIKIVHVVF